MKKKLSLSLLAVLLVTSISYAQSPFGVQAGIGLSKEVNSLFSTSFKPSIEFAGFYHIPYKDFLSFRVILGYKQRGYKDELIVSGIKKTDNTVYHLITFGPDLIFPINQSQYQIYFTTGLRINYLFDYYFSFDGDMNKRQDLDLNKVQFEANGSLGLNLRSRLYIELGVNGNFINKIDNAGDITIKAYDFNIGLSVGLHI